MKRILPLLLFVIVLFSGMSWGQTVYGLYEFTGTSTADNQFNSVTTQPSFGTFSTFTRTNVSWVSGANLFSSSAWNQGTSRDDSEYVSFSLTLSSPNTFRNITLSLSFDNLRSSTGPQNGEVMYRFASNSFASAGTWTVPTTSANFSFTIPAPGNTTETFLEIRIHGWAATSGPGNLKFDNVQLQALDSPLPVELTSFTANVIGSKVRLNWQTATEINNYGFNVERAFVETQHAASLRWEKIAFVQGNGNSNSPKNYSFTDKPMGGGEFKYRLKQIDFDGAFEYSKEVFARLEDLTRFVLEQNYPNPFNPVTKISYTIPWRANVKLRVYDMLAKEVAELVNDAQEAGRYEVTFDGTNLPSGAYFYKLEAGRFVEVKKLLLIK